MHILYTCYQPIPQDKALAVPLERLFLVRERQHTPTPDGLTSFAFSRRFGFPLPNHLATKARTGRGPETGLAQGYRARKDLASYANRDSVSECTHTLQVSLVAFQVRSWSSLSPLASSPNKHAAVTYRLDMQSLAIFLKQIQWCMTGSLLCQILWAG